MVQRCLVLQTERDSCTWSQKLAKYLHGVTLEEENKLFESGQCDSQKPLALQRILWWFLSLHFGFRARDESRKFCWGDISLKKDPDTENEMLIWKAECGTKTRKIQEGGHRREFNPKPASRMLPGHCYKMFASKRPNSMLKPDSPFYLSFNRLQKVRKLKVT